MRRARRWCWVPLWLWLACGDNPAPTAPPPATTSVAPASPQATPSAAQPASSVTAANPCDNPGPVKIELQAGVSYKTPWDLELKYVIDEDKKLGAGYTFQLRSGDRRWETRRDHRNWIRPLTWRGYCWRVGERPPQRALKIAVDVAPVCKDGKLQELGGCGAALDPS